MNLQYLFWLRRKILIHRLLWSLRNNLRDLVVKLSFHGLHLLHYDKNEPYQCEHNHFSERTLPFFQLLRVTVAKFLNQLMGGFPHSLTVESPSLLTSVGSQSDNCNLYS